MIYYVAIAMAGVAALVLMLALLYFSERIHSWDGEDEDGE